MVGGKVSDNKGINLPGVAVSVPALSEKDVEDLRWALRIGVDFIALSFVRSAADVDDVHKVMDEEGRRIPVIAKIEKPQALEAIDGIVESFDGIMVARGDLGVECPLEDVPVHQKLVIDKARRRAKPVIVATQMLESMIENPRPTRAEASDVANAVLDGADAVMLSGETSVGAYPIEAVETMARIIESTEDHGLAHMATIDWNPETRGGIIAMAAVDVAAAVRRPLHRGVHPERQTPPAGWRCSATTSPCSPSPRSTPRAPSWPCRGAWRRSRPSRSSTPTRWSARSTSSCSRPAASSRATPSSSSPAARPASPARPTRCASTRWATPSTRSLRRTTAEAPVSVIRMPRARFV